MYNKSHHCIEDQPLIIARVNDNRQCDLLIPLLLEYKFQKFQLIEEFNWFGTIIYFIINNHRIFSFLEKAITETDFIFLKNYKVFFLLKSFLSYLNLLIEMIDRIYLWKMHVVEFHKCIFFLALIKT